MSNSPQILYKLDSTGKIRTYQVEVEGDSYRIKTGVLNGTVIQSKWTVCTVKNKGRANEVSPEAQAIRESAARYRKKLDSHYFTSIEQAQTQKESHFQVMLASTPKSHSFEVLNSEEDDFIILDPKLDGMRMYCRKEDGYPTSRKGKKIPTMQWYYDLLTPFFEEYPDLILDGEVYNHDLRDDFEQLMSLAKRSSLTDDQLADAKSTLQYHIYDVTSSEHEIPAEGRKHLLRVISKVLPIGPTKFVYGINVYNEKELQQAILENINNGYEGSISRNPNSMYKNGRSKYLNKIKQFNTAEFKILDIMPGVGNASGQAGRMRVQLEDGTTNDCGLRMSWKLRDALLKNIDDIIGLEATIRFFGRTSDNKLRFPVCIEIDRWKHE